jgi:hypothetical protein
VKWKDLTFPEPALEGALRLFVFEPQDQKTKQMIKEELLKIGYTNTIVKFNNGGIVVYTTNNNSKRIRVEMFYSNIDVGDYYGLVC